MTLTTPTLGWFVSLRLELAIIILCDILEVLDFVIPQIGLKPPNLTTRAQQKLKWATVAQIWTEKRGAAVPLSWGSWVPTYYNVALAKVYFCNK